MTNEPMPLSKARMEILSRAAGVCFDLDDTFTSSGKIASEAWRSLWAAHEAGLAMVAVTGRPAGWCDLVCRYWPVAGVVGENGAFYFAHDKKRRRIVRRFARSARKREEDRRRLDEVAMSVLRAVPRARISADQPFRIADLAVDFAEDVGPLTGEEVERVVEVMRSHGAAAKVSSIHVNCWFGRYDKQSMLLRFARDRLDLEEADARRRLVYVGDSPNDEPLFATFSLSVGVANVRRFLPEMKAPPAFITKGAEGAGFSELVRAVIRARASTKSGGGL